jgi:hypothetical protein
VKSNGKFTSFDYAGTFAVQEWYNPSAQVDGFPVGALTKQAVQVTKLALLVIPSNNVLGTFAVSGQVKSGTTTFPAGSVGGTLTASANGVSCSIEATPRPFSNPPSGLPSQYRFYASICAEPTTLNGQAGYQQVTVNYIQTFDSQEELNPGFNPGAWTVQPGYVDVGVQLDFTLPGNAPDMVKGTIRIYTGDAVSTGFGSSVPSLANMTRWRYVNSLGLLPQILP